MYLHCNLTCFYIIIHVHMQCSYAFNFLHTVPIKMYRLCSTCTCMQFLHIDCLYWLLMKRNYSLNLLYKWRLWLSIWSNHSHIICPSLELVSRARLSFILTITVINWNGRGNTGVGENVRNVFLEYCLSRETFDSCIERPW